MYAKPRVETHYAKLCSTLCIHLKLVINKRIFKKKIYSKILKSISICYLILY